MPSRPTSRELLELPLFAGLSPSEVAGIASQATIVEHPAGSYVFRRGERGDELYVVLVGQVAIELSADELLALAGPGDWFGEMALLTLAPRSADARVRLDTRLLGIDRTAWADVGTRAPLLLARLCERLSAHVRAGNEPARPRRRTVVAIDSAGNGPIPWVHDLAASLRRQFPHRAVHALGRDGLPLDRTANQAGALDRNAIGRAVARIIDPDAVILLPPETDGLIDCRLGATGATEWRLTAGDAGHATRHIRGADPRDSLDRVARHVGGGRVGLALGAGGAYGLSELGMLDVFERAGIPIDVVTGTSIGPGFPSTSSPAPA